MDKSRTQVFSMRTISIIEVDVDDGTSEQGCCGTSGMGLWDYGSGSISLLTAPLRFRLNRRYVTRSRYFATVGHYDCILVTILVQSTHSVSSSDR